MSRGENTAVVEEEGQQRRSDFLKAFRRTGSVKTSAAEIGMSWRHVYYWRQQHPEFSEEVQLIIDRHDVDRLVVAMEATQ